MQTLLYYKGQRTTNPHHPSSYHYTIYRVGVLCLLWTGADVANLVLFFFFHIYKSKIYMLPAGQTAGIYTGNPQVYFFEDFFTIVRLISLEEYPLKGVTSDSSI